MDHTMKWLNEMRKNPIVEDYLRRYHEERMEAARREQEERVAADRRRQIKIAA